MDEALYPPLSAALIRRAISSLPAWDDQALRHSTTAEDIRFFALSWAAGLAFFLVYLG